MHVANASAGGFRDLAAICFDPIEVAYAVLIVRRLYRDFPRAFCRGLTIDFQGDELSREILEVRIDILIRTCFVAIYGNQIVPGFHFQTGIRERRACRFNPIFPRIDLCDTLVATIAHETRASHSAPALPPLALLP